MFDLEKKRPGILRILFCAVMILGCIAVLVNGIRSFCLQVSRSEWPQATATVTEVNEKTKIKSDSKRTVYDIEYTYTVDQTDHIGTVKEKGTPLKVGDTLEVKYDPAAPEVSTDVLSPNADALIINVFMSLFIANVSLFALGFPSLFSLLFGAFSSKKELSDDEKAAEKEKRFSCYMGDGSGYPLKLSLSGLRDAFAHRGAWIPLSVGICFVPFGILLSGWFYICTAAGAGIYICKGVLEPLLLVDNCYKTLGETEFYRVLKKGYFSKSHPHQSDWERIMYALIIATEKHR